MTSTPCKLLLGILSLTMASLIGIGNILADETTMRPLRKPMSHDQLTQFALSAAPRHIAQDATVMLPGDDGKPMEVRKGTNGFTCMPDTNPNSDRLEPMCMNQATAQWFTSFKNNAPKPSNTVPGIAYMAKGAELWIKDGKLLLKPEGGAVLLDFPPHWMIFWPFDPKESGFPSCTVQPEQVVRPGNVCMIFEGSPYAALLIFQNLETAQAKR
jgi:hypothetical protein